MPMDPKNLTPQEKQQLHNAEMERQRERISNLLFESRNRILRTSQNKVNTLLEGATASDRGIITQAAYEAAIVLTMKYEETLRAHGMPPMLIQQVKSEALMLAIDSILAGAQKKGPQLIVDPGGKGGS